MPCGKRAEGNIYMLMCVFFACARLNVRKCQHRRIGKQRRYEPSAGTKLTLLAEHSLSLSLFLSLSSSLSASLSLSRPLPLFPSVPLSPSFSLFFFSPASAQEISEISSAPHGVFRAMYVAMLTTMALRPRSASGSSLLRSSHVAHRCRLLGRHGGSSSS